VPTAEEAAAANLAWRAVNAPATVTATEQAQAQQYRSNYYNIEQPAQQARDAAIQQTIIQNRQMINRQEGLGYAGTHTQAQLAALSGSAAVGRQAYEQERSYYESAPSSEFQRLTGQYAASRNQIVTGNRVYAATGELELNTTAAAGGYTGRAAEYKSAFERQVYGIGAPNNEQEYYRRQAEQAAVERLGYTAPKDLGDIRTQQIRQGYGMFSQAVGLAGGEVASDYQMTGRIIETQRQAAYATPTRRDERFFMGELQKWAQIPVEKSAAYHDIGMESGVRIPANPYEYQADLAVEFLKGSPDKSSEFFSPVSGEMSRYLPKGQGVQEFAWGEAITDYKRQNVDARTPYPKQVSFMEGVKYLGAAEGKYGPYGNLYGGIPNGGVGVGGNRLRGGNVVGGSEISGVYATGLPKPFVSISAQASQPDLLTQAGLWLEGAERTTVEYTGIGRLPTPTTEQIKEMGKNPLFMSTNPAAAGLLVIPQTQEYAASFIRGEAVQIKTKPLESAISYGIGYAGGIAFKGVEYGFSGLRVSVAAKAISSGGGWRAAEVFAANVPRVAGMALTVAYAGSVAARTTNMGTDFSPAAAERLGAITVGEALPGGFGFVHGYRTPSTVYKAAQLSDIGYKAALQERAVTGRAEYYVKQPAMAAYERASLPITRARLELPQFVEEAGGSPIKGAARYAGYKIGMETPVIPEVSRNYYSFEGIERVAYPRAAGKTVTPEITRNYYPYEGIERIAYPKGKGIDLGASIQSRAIDVHARVWPYYQAAKTPSITLRSMWQERGGIDMTNIIRPTAEITRINKMSSFRYPEGVTPEGISKNKMNVWEKQGFASPTRKLTGEQSPIKPQGTTEIKSKWGSLLSRVEEVPMSRNIEQATMVEPMTRGLPVWPSGPSPIQKQRYVIEEETQYYRLPPGMTSPGPKQETRQNFFAISDIASRSRLQMQMQSPLQNTAMMVRSRQDTVQRQRTELSPRFETKPEVSTRRMFDQLRTPEVSTRNITMTEIVQTPFAEVIPTQRTAQDQMRAQIQTPVIPQAPRENPFIQQATPPIEPYIPGGYLPGGGGGTGYKGNLGITRWQRNNLVATSEYLSRGMRDIGMGWGSGTGTYSESTKWFSTGKKKSKRRRKK